MLPSCVPESVLPPATRRSLSYFLAPCVRPCTLPLSLCVSFHPELCLSACPEGPPCTRSPGEDATPMKDPVLQEPAVGGTPPASDGTDCRKRENSQASGE